MATGRQRSHESGSLRSSMIERDTRFEGFDNFVGRKKKWMKSRRVPRLERGWRERRRARQNSYSFSFPNSIISNRPPADFSFRPVARSREGKDQKISSAHFTRAEKCILRMQDPKGASYSFVQTRPRPTLLVIYKREGWWRGKKERK